MTAQNNVIDEVAWVVGDSIILCSDIETQRSYNRNEEVRLDGDPYCVIPEQMVIQELYLNQAKINSIAVDENQVIQGVDQWTDMAVNQIRSRKKLEEYFGEKFSQIKDERKEVMWEQQIVQQAQYQLIGEIKLTSSEVRKYFSQLFRDSLPNTSTTVGAQIITLGLKIPFEEADAIRARLRDFTEQVSSGKMGFSTLACLCSEDPGSVSRGGGLGFMSRTQLLSEFANAAFNLKDSKRVSQIVQMEYGHRIIQLIGKRGDRINCRHILLKPKTSSKELTGATTHLDLLYNDLQANKFMFEETATFVSYDKDTHNNKDSMVSQDYESSNMGTSKLEMQGLPREIGKMVYDMKVEEISKPFTMLTNKQKEVVVIAKPKVRAEGHKANLANDFQALKVIVEAKKCEELLNDWIAKK